jgi:hypothetical protein
LVSAAPAASRAAAAIWASSVPLRACAVRAAFIAASDTWRATLFWVAWSPPALVTCGAGAGEGRRPGAGVGERAVAWKNL